MSKSISEASDFMFCMSKSLSEASDTLFWGQNTLSATDATMFRMSLAKSEAADAMSGMPGRFPRLRIS
ncbi:MAG: hypothetical protein LBK07_06475 [Tannerella sp.]|jgi:hypothetical protein|nr:hypothetical protein [Tannerella sp.]